MYFYFFSKMSVVQKTKNNRIYEVINVTNPDQRSIFLLPKKGEFFLTKPLFRAIIRFKVISELFPEHFSEYEKNHIKFPCCLCFPWFKDKWTLIFSLSVCICGKFFGMVKGSHCSFLQPRINTDQHKWTLIFSLSAFICVHLW